MIETKLPNGVVPYQHQVEAAEHIFHQRSALNAFDVGVGKTLTSILVARAYQRTVGGKVVVIAPASLLENWGREVDGLLDPIILSASKIPSPDDFGDGRFYLIADEAHYYQDFYSKRTKDMIALASAADGFLPMTATPIRNYPSNIFPLMQMVGHPIGDNYTAFVNRYCNGDLSGSSNLIELHDRIQTKVILGSKEDFLELPPFTRILQPIQFHGASKILFDNALESKIAEYEERVRSGEVSEWGWILVILNYLRQAASLAKAPYTVKFAEGYLLSGQQVAIFTNFTSTAKYIERWLKHYGLELLYGGVPKHKRQALVDRFQEGESKLFIMTRAGSAGLNLQQGTVFISNDRTWSPFDMIQAEGRIYRNGQNKPCRSLWMQDTVIDPYLDRMMLRKYRVARLALAGRIDTLDGVGDPGSWADSIWNFITGYEPTFVT